MDLGPEPEPEPEVGEAEVEVVPRAGGESEIKILITRHSFSCNQKVVTKAPDPALTRMGIDMAMERAKYNYGVNNRLYDSEIVLVSCLLRTWQTALLLYNPKFSDVEDRLSPKMDFTLYVYPYLKEHRMQVKVPFLGSVFDVDRGNHPTELKLTLANFLKFLEFIRVNYSEYYINCLPLQINIIIWNEEGSTLTFSLTRNGINKNPFVVKINEEDCNGCWNSRDNNMIDPFLRQGSIFKDDGDLNVFVGSIARLSDSDKNRLAPNGTVHVVAHSTMMETYLNQYIDRTTNDLRFVPTQDENGRPMSFSENDDKKDMIIRNIKSTNMFSFEMGLSEDGGKLNKVYLGLSIPETSIEKNRDLCDGGQLFFLDPKLVRVNQREPEYKLEDNVMIIGTRSDADGKTGRIIGYYIDGSLTESQDGNNLGLTPANFERLKRNKTDVIRVEYKNSREEIVEENFFKEKIRILNPENSVTLTLAGGGKLKKSKRKNKKTIKRNKNKSKRRNSKRRKNTKRK